MKKLIPWLLIGVCALALTGCPPEKTETNVTPDGSGSSAPESTTSSGPESTGTTTPATTVPAGTSSGSPLAPAQ
ncbi:MAG: hypothetical protein WC728_08855 [Elusimicrobiota bacterium]